MHIAAVVLERIRAVAGIEVLTIALHSKTALPHVTGVYSLLELELQRAAVIYTYVLILTSTVVH